MPDLVILANTRWNREGEGRGGNSSPQYADAVMRRGWRVAFIQKDGLNSLTPLETLDIGPQTVVMCDVPWVDFYWDLFMQLKAQGCPSVYRIVDNWLYTPRLADYDADREAAFIRAADVVCASNPLSIERFREARPDILLLRNGVDLDFFWNWSGPPPADLKMGSPTIIFVSSLWDPGWIDWEALLHAAGTRPELSFNIIGDPEKVSLRAAPPNLHFLGRRPWSALPAYLHHSDIGLVPYLPARTQYNNPLKVLEYLACRLPVVTAPNPSLQDYPHLFCYHNREEFCLQIDRAAQARIDRKALYRILQEHTWEKRLDKLLAKIYPPSQEPPAA